MISYSVRLYFTDPTAHLDKYFEEKERKNRERLESLKLKSQEMIQQRREKMEQWVGPIYKCKIMFNFDNKLSISDVPEKSREGNGGEGISSAGNAPSTLSHEIYFPYFDKRSGRGGQSTPTRSR